MTHARACSGLVQFCSIEAKSFVYANDSVWTALQKEFKRHWDPLSPFGASVGSVCTSQQTTKPQACKSHVRYCHAAQE